MNHQAPQSAMEEQQVDPEPVVADTQAALPAAEREVGAELEHEALEISHERVLEIGLRVLVVKTEELEHQRIFDGLLRRHLVFAPSDLTLVEHRDLVSRQRRALVEQRVDLTDELPDGPAAPKCFGLVELSRGRVLDLEQLHVVRPRKRQLRGHFRQNRFSRRRLPNRSFPIEFRGRCPLNLRAQERLGNF